jgi:hypothetical protein
MPKGILTLTFRDAETMEVIREETAENVFTTWGSKLLMMISQTGGGASLSNSTNISMVDVSNGYALIGISNRKPNPSRALTSLKNVYALGTVLVAPSWNAGTPYYIELKNRFTAPATARVINSIYIGPNNTAVQLGQSCIAVAVLPSPCSQATTEVLDITYRIQIYEQPYSNADSKTIRNSSVGGLYQAYDFVSGSQYCTAQFADTTWAKIPPNTLNYMTLAGSGNNFTSYNITYDWPRYRKTWSKSFATSDRVGQVMSSIMFSGYQPTGTGTLWPALNNTPVYSMNYLTPAWGPMTTSAFTNKPIQTIHNHNANAVAPFLDVSFLATSQGSINVSASSWDVNGYPEFNRVEFTSTGAVGVAKYMYRKRIMLGFTEGNSYLPAPNTYNQYLFQDPSTPTAISIVNFKGMSSFINFIEQYDTKRTVTFEATGISVLNFLTGEAVTFHSTTSPALPVTNVGQVAVDTLGNIWVGCRNTGLYKITNPITSPTITKMSVATNGIPADTGCFGVSAGYNGKIWAAFDGGLSATANNGTSWTNYSPTSSPVFSFTGITNSNWNVIQLLRVDINSVDDQMAVLAGPAVAAANTRKIIWWSLTTATSVGPQTTDNSAQGFTTPLYGAIRCSKYGSGWAMCTATAANSTQNSVWSLTFNTATTTVLVGVATNNVSGNYNQAAFLYDYYGTPYSMASQTTIVSTTYTNLNCLDSVSYGGTYCGIIPTFSASGNSAGFAFSTEMYPNANPIVWSRLMSAASYTVQTTGASAGFPVLLNQASPAGYIDPLNGRYSPYEEMAWEKYHWNGSAWQLNYYAPAVDTSNYTLNAARHNFDTETHTFTGRSLINASSSFTSSSFTSNATFAFYINPVAKLTTNSHQEATRTLLSIEDGVSLFRIVWDNGAASLVIQQGNATTANGTSTTVVATPANGSNYRIVVTVAGTTCKVYSNGVQLGTNITLAATPNWANTSNNLKVYIGSRVYSRIQTLNNPWPSNFFKGSITNVQFWNVAWTATDVTNDNAAPTGVISSQPIANMRARFELTQSLAGLETKTTHSTYQVLPNGTQIKFNDGASGSSFVTGDYYTYGVCDGILKDNAISFTDSHSLYYKPINSNFGEFLNGAGTNVITATTGVVTEPLQISSASLVDYLQGDIIRHWRVSSNFSQTEFSGTSNPTNLGGALGAQGITANGSISFQTVGPDEDESWIGLSTDVATVVTSTAVINYGFEFLVAGTVTIRELGVSKLAGTTYVQTDVFKIERVGTVVKYYKNGSLLYTSLTASSGTLYTRAAFAPITGCTGTGFIGTSITYDLQPYFMNIGNSTTLTGKFSPDFIHVEDGIANTISIALNGGSPITVTVTNVAMHLIPTPIAGTAYLHSSGAWLKFNPADVGSTVSGYVTVIYDKF